MNLTNPVPMMKGNTMKSFAKHHASLLTRIGGVSLFVLSIGLVPALASCNTTEGIGEDIEEAGDALEDEADEYDDY